MKLKLFSILKILFIILITSSCANNFIVEGNWGAVSSEGDYAELFFSGNQILIFSEVGGIIPSQRFVISNDSLKTNLLTYKIDWINPDSLILKSNTFILNLKRIKKGFKFSDFTNESHEQHYIDDFYDRMNKRKES